MREGGKESREGDKKEGRREGEREDRRSVEGLMMTVSVL